MGKNIFIILLGTICFVNAFAQPAVDGFMKGVGNVDLVASGTFDTYSKYFAFTGKRNIKRSTTSFSFFAAGGVTKWLDAQVNIPYVITKVNYTNFQDASFYLKAKLVESPTRDGKFTLLYTPGASIPMSKYIISGLNAIGQHAIAIDNRIVVQFTQKNGWFGMMQSGYTTRTNPTPASLPFAFKVGKAAANYYFDVYFDYQEAFGGSDYRDGKGLPFTTLGVSYRKIGGTFYKPFLDGKIGVVFGGFVVYAGRNVGQSIGVNSAFIYKLNLLKK